MSSAKDLLVKPIASADARRITAANHYSRTWVNNSQVHLGVFLRGRCGGVMSFGPSMCKRALVGLVTGTRWNEFIELNRMAFADWLPRNSESRALGYALRWMRKQYPHLSWVVSFADACQCGDGTIYRAVGFLLTGISRGQLWRLPPKLAALHGAPVCHRLTVQDKSSAVSRYVLGLTKGRNLTMDEYARRFGGEVVPGGMLRYVYFLDPEARARLTVPVLPYSEIERQGLSMYKGKRRAGSIETDVPATQAGEGGVNPTPALQSFPPADDAKVATQPTSARSSECS
ncbi:MAG: hypothetical protein JXL80_05755 [Planctomycetes bacterium]|nr:hypothetical protein [Planctomycetota bacterium]